MTNPIPHTLTKAVEAAMNSASVDCDAPSTACYGSVSEQAIWRACLAAVEACYITDTGLVAALRAKVADSPQRL